MENKKFYLVISEKGEYSNYTMYNDGIFSTKDKAIQYIEAIGNKLETNENLNNYFDEDSDQIIYIWNKEKTKYYVKNNYKEEVNPYYFCFSIQELNIDEWTVKKNYDIYSNKHTLLEVMKYFAEFSEKYNSYTCGIYYGKNIVDSFLPNPSFYGHTYIKELIKAMLIKTEEDEILGNEIAPTRYTKDMLKYQNNWVTEVNINHKLKWITIEFKKE